MMILPQPWLVALLDDKIARIIGVDTANREALVLVNERLDLIPWAKLRTVREANLRD